LIDIPTLSVAIGLSNLVFALLVTIYKQSAHTTIQPLSIWRWGRLVCGMGFLLIWLRPVIPLWLSLLIGNSMLLTAWVIDFSAYAGLLGRKINHVALVVLGGLAVLGFQATVLLGYPRGVSLIYNSFANSAFLGAIAFMLLTNQTHRGRLTRLIGFTYATGSLLFLARAIRGIIVDAPTPFDTNVVNVSLWMVGYLVIIVNGFGFLLLAKQDDDERLREALAEVERAELEQRRLLSLASHEFRTPAAMIKISLDSLKVLRDELTPAVATRIHNIHHASQRLSGITNTLITQDRLRDRRFALRLQEVDLKTLVGNVTAAYPDDIRVIFPESELMIQADPALLAIALHNLLDNAFRHGDAAIPPTVGVTLQDGWINIEVGDQGEGITESDRKRVFERYYSENNERGAGLGLSIVRDIALLHGGEVAARDNQPAGALLSVRLPQTAVTRG
jgi:signal transduction histidine kinase